jgi:Zn ribbon nucleic-acid-binding protein
MKIRWKTDRIEIEVDGADTKDCFAELAGAIEVFGVSTCGACDSTNTVPVTRENKGNHFYEVRCVDCGCSIGFGQRKSDGALYPRRKDQDGNLIGTNGWSKWSKREVDSPF